VRRRTAHRAFTLIEMLVSLAIVGTIVTMVYGSYAATSRSLDVYGRRMACSERAHLALRIMARQIRCVYVPTTPTSTPTFQAEPRNLRGDILSFSTTAGFGRGHDGPTGISRVAYRYDPSSKTLSISCEPRTGRSDNPQRTDAWRPMLAGVTNVELGFYDGRNWQSQWDPKRSGPVPQAVKIALSVTDELGREHHYGTTVPIICRGTPWTQQVKKAGGPS
jgi:prepilin-type N-terminal cleavage/methylation domain-containing protein